MTDSRNNLASLRAHANSWTRDARENTAAKDSYLDSYLCYLDSYLDRPVYLAAIFNYL